MARVRRIEIGNFRAIRKLDWFPAPGVNCLIGPGDVGKSTVLDAVDLCLGARRTVQFSDTDFHRCNVAEPIEISVTIGELADTLKSLDGYGLYLRGFKHAETQVLPEPEAGAETVLTIRLTVSDDLEPSWVCYSERAHALGQARPLSWADRLKIAPTRLGMFADHHLSWRRGSILNRVSDERADVAADLAQIVRETRAAFGDQVKDHVSGTLAIVREVASNLGIAIPGVTAMLDAESVSRSGATISLHGADGIPLRELGLGSTRLLLAGLQRRAAEKNTIILVDEVEHGLEPHRIIRLTTSLGAKETAPPLQSFLTTHSPVALQELSADQLYVLRWTAAGHEVLRVGSHNDMQATVRACPGAFLAPSVVVCEGASEIGIVRGLDLYRVGNGEQSMLALGVTLADGHGATTFRRANAFATLGYRTLVLRDDDTAPDSAELGRFTTGGGTVLAWTNKRALEEELFMRLSNRAVMQLIELAVENVGEQTVEANIRSASSNQVDLTACRALVTSTNRAVLGKAAKSKNGSWFKTVTAMEAVGREVVGPDLQTADAALRAIVDNLFAWVACGTRG